MTACGVARRLLMTGASFSVLIGGAAQAQTAPAQGEAAASVSDIVVTARRRSERLQDVPAAISVVTGEQLQLTGASDYRDYLNDIPAVRYMENGYRTSRVIIRGVSDGFAQTSPLTGIYIDEAPVSEGFSPTFDPSLYDVERVEVLKGPQGTLYGSGSMGGTVRVILNKPKLDVVEGSVDGSAAQIDGGGGLYRANGAVNLPLVSEKLALRLVGSYRRDDGFIDNPRLNLSEINDLTKYNARGQLLFQATPDTSILLSASYQDEDFGAPNFSDVNLPEYQHSRVYNESGGGESKLFGLTVNHDFGWGSLVSATNLLQKRSDAFIDASSSLGPVVGMLTGVAIPSTQGLGLPTETNFEVFTQEFRLSSNGDGRLQWVVGAFYSESDNDVSQFFDLSQAPILDGVITSEALYQTTATFGTRQIAAFGDLTYKITDKLSATVGLRAFDAEQKNRSFASGLFNGNVTTRTVSEASDSSLNQKYVVKYEVSPDSQVYAQAVQGYRLGGPNSSIPPVCNTDLANLGYTSAPSAFGSDSLWNYEVGTKNAFLDRRVTLNAAAYYIEWEDIQSTLSLPGCGLNFQVNAGKAVSKGAEVETSIRLVDGLTVNAAVAYVDAELEESATGAGPKPGDRLPGVADWAGNVNLRYERPVTGQLDGFAFVGASYTGSRWNQYRSINARSYEMDPYWLVDARFGVRAQDWTVSLFATNLFNEKVVLHRAPAAASYDVVATPRVIGLAATKNF